MIKHINSKQQLLSNHDILVVAANDHPESAQKHYKDAGSPAQATPQLLLFTIFSKLFEMKNAIRLREGNSIFLLIPAERGTMFLMFDGDTPNNTINNIVIACEAARKMGFKKLIAPVENSTVANFAKRAFEKHHKSGDKLSIRNKIITLELNNG